MEGQRFEGTENGGAGRRLNCENLTRRSCGYEENIEAYSSIHAQTPVDVYVDPFLSFCVSFFWV